MAIVSSSNWENSDIYDNSTWVTGAGTTGLSVATDHYFVGSKSLKYSSTSSNLHEIWLTGLDIGDFGVLFAIRINAMVMTIGAYDIYLNITDSISFGEMFELQAISKADYESFYGVGSWVAAGYSADSDFYFAWWDDGSQSSLQATGSYSQANRQGNFDTWYQIELRFTKGSYEGGKLWSADGNTLLWQGENTTSVPNYDADRFRFGLTESPGGTNIVWLDDFIINTGDWVGPRTTGSAGTGIWYVDNGIFRGIMRGMY
jgi:hypothetical protein